MEALAHVLCQGVARVFFFWPALSEYPFMQRALVGLLLLAPLCATIGIQVVNFRLAFFAEAVGHSSFTGIALGLTLALVPAMHGIDPTVAMTIFGVAVACAITLYRRRTALPSDTVIGVFSTSVIALGLCVITHLIQTNKLSGAGNLMNFLTGNILTVTDRDLARLCVLFVVGAAFQAWSYNRLMFIGLNAPLAQTVGIRVGAYEYAFAILLACVVMFSIKVIGALLVTAMLVIPAAAARNVARNALSVFWLSIAIATCSAVAGLALADYFSMATGATAVLCATVIFLATTLASPLARQ